MVVELVLELAARVLTSLARADPAEVNAERTPSAFEVRGFATAFEAWRKAHHLEGEAAVVRGVIAGVPVRVRAGLGGSRPSGVEIEMTLAHEDARVRLLTRDAEDATPLGRALGAAFGTPRLERLRSVAVLPNGLRARLLPLSPPEDLDAVVEACAEAVRSVRAPTAPYR